MLVRYSGLCCSREVVADGVNSKSVAVLVVDDDPHMLAVLRRLARRLPVLLCCATSPGEALEMLKVLPAMVVLSAYRMPQIDGLAFLRLVRQRYGAHVKCVLHTGVPQEALAAGCDVPVFTKPISEEAFRQLVSDAISDER